MGMPGSETALEEMMCRVLGDLIQEGCVAKIADDLYCGGATPEELLKTWTRVLEQLDKCNLRLSPTKTVICPKSTTILGWVWSNGQISASPHRVAVLSSCTPPETVKGMRSFIGSYKVLSRVLPDCSSLIDPLEQSLAGLNSQDKLNLDDNLLHHFRLAQQALKSTKAITLPRPTDKLFIVTDGSVKKHGIGATLYALRGRQLHLAGFFSSKLRKHQVTWLPCEIEALGIAAAVKHFSPLIIQSDQRTCVLTNSKPCVQALGKLARGEFSASPRVTSFLTTASRYQVSVQHLAGNAYLPSDFASRNAPEYYPVILEESNSNVSTGQEIYNVAPGENKHPVSLMTDKLCEELAFPVLFPKDYLRKFYFGK
ncbi:Transposon Ty3-G Gag-Pol polyprotein [Exaiptasia diaphana]|nr:Transposon Ty3-G Gag-Pol polyprotein [Exaiptasia diaphana]